jgi:hypothetical protein
VAYDDALAERIRDVLAVREGVTERKMFGGIGFMVADNTGLAGWVDAGADFAASPPSK